MAQTNAPTLPPTIPPSQAETDGLAWFEAMVQIRGEEHARRTVALEAFAELIGDAE